MWFPTKSGRELRIVLMKEAGADFPEIRTVVWGGTEVEAQEASWEATESAPKWHDLWGKAKPATDNLASIFDERRWRGWAEITRLVANLDADEQ
jgi:hypothetical protein